MGSVRTDWPRLIDHAKWVTAAEPQLGWKSGAFIEACNANRAETNARVIDDDKVATEVIELADAGGWSGTATELLAKINPSGDPGFPRGANKLSQRLSELKPNLRAVGVNVDFDRQGSASTKVIQIGKRIVQKAA